MSDDGDHLAPPFSNNNSPSPSPSSPPCTDNNQLALLPPPSLTPALTSSRTPVFPSREDCWLESATHTLIQAWGSKYVELNRGNLRHHHWEQVANAVNALHAHSKKQYRTDIQCKNRIDTLKKKYKIERTKVSQSNGRYVSTWPFFNSLNALIGVNFKVSPSPPPPPPPVTSAVQWRTPKTETPLQWRTPKPETPLQWRSPPYPQPEKSLQWRSPPPLPSSPAAGKPIQWREPPLAPPLFGVPVGLRSTVSRRNFSAMAAAAAAMSDSGEEAAAEEEESETSSLAASAMAINASGRSKRKRDDGFNGYKMVAEAIGRFSEIYERVEKAKQRQMVELEKQRMQFAKDLEIQRMKLIMESQVHLEKLKCSKMQFRRW